jgi:hypothetical protein
MRKRALMGGNVKLRIGLRVLRLLGMLGVDEDVQRLWGDWGCALWLCCGCMVVLWHGILQLQQVPQYANHGQDDHRDHNGLEEGSQRRSQGGVGHWDSRHHGIRKDRVP